MNYEWDIPETCPDCGHRAEYAIKVAYSEIGAVPTGWAGYGYIPLVIHNFTHWVYRLG